MRKDWFGRGTVVLVMTLGWSLILAMVFPAAVLAQIPSLTLQVASTGWGDTEVTDIERVLQNTASHLSCYFPGLDLPPISVVPGDRPIVLYQRGPDGQFMVHLRTGNRYWAQFAFQFSHELCHILSRFDEDPTGCRWFEESLCELASLFAVRGMSKSWMNAPPYPNWSGYASALADYATQRINQHPLTRRFVLADWYRDHAVELTANAENRDLNLVVAEVLLPMFEAAPEHWQALQYLNNGQPTMPQAFADYLGDWFHNSPIQHRQFILEIARQFGVEDIG